MRYFAIIDGEQCGPFRLEELPEAGVGPDTYVWCKGMIEWRKAEEVGDICRFFRQRLSGVGIEDSGEEKDTAGNGEDLTDELPLRYRRIIESSGTPLSRNDEQMQPSPRPMILEAILVTLFCFPITGAVALYFAIRTSNCLKSGNDPAAREYSRLTKMWIGFSFFIGIIIIAYLAFSAGMK